MTQLAFNAAHAVMKKISINVPGKDAANTIFTLPLEGIELSREQLNTILGDRTFEAWFQQKSDGSYHPMDYWRTRKNGDYAIDDEFTCDELTVEVSGGKKIEFETEEAGEDDEDAEDVPAAKIGSLVFKPLSGGITMLSLHLQVRPRNDKDNLLLQKHMYRPVTVTFDASVTPRKNAAQGALAFGNGTGTPAGTDTDESQRATSGGFVQTKSAEEIDAEMRKRNPDTPLMGDDNQAFEEGARAQVAAFNAKPGEVIDGRSERVKHCDAQRGPGGRSRHR